MGMLSCYLDQPPSLSEPLGRHDENFQWSRPLVMKKQQVLRNSRLLPVLRAYTDNSWL